MPLPDTDQITATLITDPRITALPKIRFGEVSFDPLAIGSQGNAILGIRDSGKTYAAMKLAEELMDAGIPIIAFDPIGVWRFLRVPGPDGRGYPVVVAGGAEGDLPIDAETAPALIEAAMKAGVSLVIDLFDINLSKADWRRIVEASLRTLLHKNQAYGLRHVFLEEAAEFCPQRPGIEVARVYAEVEKLARMGGNCRLGYTLINQRSEEVAKAVLELCDNLFLFRQKGRNSLNALSKWLDMGNVAAGKHIISTLSTLETGKCWAWPQGSDVPILVHVPAKNSLHPDRRVMRGAEGAPVVAPKVDVGTFVAAMNKLLAKPAKAETSFEVGKAAHAAIIVARDEGYKAGYDAGKAEGWAAGMRHLSEGIRDTLNILAGTQADQRIAAVAAERTAPVAARQPPPARDAEPQAAPQAAPEPRAGVAPVNGLTNPQAHLLATLVATSKLYGGGVIDKDLLAFMAEVSPNSSGYANNLGAMRRMGLIDYPIPGTVKATPAGEDAAPIAFLPATNDQVQRAVLNRLSKPQQRILEVVLESHPEGISRTVLAERAGVSASSSGFANNLGALRSLGLIDYPAPGSVCTTDLLFPYGKDAR